jgi:chromosome segregation ATPase
LHAEVEEQTRRLTEEGERITKGLAELKALEGEKATWEAELAQARAGAAAAIKEAELARQRKMEFDAAVAEASARMAEFRVLEEKRSQLELQVAAAETTLTELRREMEAVEGQRRQLQDKQAALEARERTLLTREQEESGKRQMADMARRAEEERIAQGRREIAEGQAELLRERTELDRRMREVEAAREEAEVMARESGEVVERDRAEAQEKMAEAREALEEMNEARARQDQRWTALEARATELAEAEESAAAKGRELAVREEQLKTAKREVDEAQGQLLMQQDALLGAERQLAEKIAAAEGEIAAKLAAAEAAKRQVEEEREGLARQRKELDKKLDLMEGELAEQFEAIARQTKRLTDRRADLDARSAEVEKEVETRVGRATELLQKELLEAKDVFERRVLMLQEQLEKSEAASAAWRSRESELEKAVAQGRRESEGLKQQLERVGQELDEASRGRTEQGQILAEQLMRFERESADWKRRLDLAVADAADNEGLKEAIAAADSARAEVETLRARLDEMTAAKEDAENRLLVQQARAGEMDKLAESLAAKLGTAEREIGELKGQIETLTDAATRGAGDAPHENLEVEGKLRAEVKQLTGQIQVLEAQRQDLVGQLFAIQDEMRRQAEEGLLAKNVVEGELVTLRDRNQSLEADMESMRQRVAAIYLNPPASAAVDGRRGVPSRAEREKLLRKARTLRAYRKGVLETKEILAKSSEELGRQREQLKARKENLEQVKRLLEKQEMVMARKLADHNALKTVAAVGIFLIMILGSVFLGVYKFVSPMYRSEAVVQLAPPAGLEGVELQAWLTRQMEFMRSNEVTFAAWKVLRSEGENYSMHDVREQWMSSLGTKLNMELDGAARRLSIRYMGPNAHGVSQVCNALATAYVNPGVRENLDAAGPGAGAMIMAKASAPQYPAQDNRVMTSLSVTAVVLFISFIAVLLFRHYVRRQLREIDRMADEEDLAGLKGELA